MPVGGPHPKAERLWAEIGAYLARSTICDDEWIRVIPLGKQVGLHPQQTREIVRYWSNEGLVGYAGSSADKILLTDKGRRRLDDYTEM